MGGLNSLRRDITNKLAKDVEDFLPQNIYFIYFMKNADYA